MASVELIYDPDCPNVVPARAQLLRAFVQVGLKPKWQEWDRSSADSPKHVRTYGSPTILIDGKDVSGESASPATGDASSCRIYDLADGQNSGVPPLESVVSAMFRMAATSAGTTPRKSGKWGPLVMLPTVGFALLPKVACPACWPAYAGVLSSLGVGFLVNNEYLLALTAGFLTFAVGILAFRAKERRGYAPFFLGIFAGAIVLIGKFHYESDPAMYAGLGILIAASLWNSWPRLAVKDGSCSSCVQAEPPVKS